jgi:hypothetical protein
MQAFKASTHIQQSHPSTQSFHQPSQTPTPPPFFLPSLRHINQTVHVIAACATNIIAEKMKPLWNLGASTAGNTR